MKDVTNTAEDIQNDASMDDMEGEKKKPWLQRTKEGGVRTKSGPRSQSSNSERG